MVIVLTLLALPASAQNWVVQNGSSSLTCSTATPCLIVNQKGSGKIVSFRANGVEVWAVDFAGGMTVAGATKFADGTAALPGIAFASEPSLGFAREFAGYISVTKKLTGPGAAAVSVSALVSDGTVQAAAASTLGWNTRALMASPADGQVTLTNNQGTGSILLDTGGTGNGQVSAFRTLTELTTIAAAATTDTAIQMPAGAIVLAVSVRVTVVIPTATTFTVGDSGSAARFSTAAVSVAANSTDPGTKAGAYYNAGALAVRITPNGTPGANTGRVRVTVFYFLATPPSS